MSTRQQQFGFTAVELLITLFVAAGFLIASYQLYNLIIKDGGSTRSESRAANVAYDYLRQYSASATTIPCTASTPLNNAPISVESLTNVKITVAVVCLPDAPSSVSRVDVSITYNVPTQTLKYSTLTSSAGTSTANDITNGLIAWWKLNGNANNSVGSLNGTIVNATSTTNQQNQADMAYNFSGSNQTINFDNAVVPTGSSSFTVSIWVKRGRNNVGYEEMVSQYTNAAGGNSFYFGFQNSNIRFTDQWDNVPISGAGVTGSWMHIVGVNDVTTNNAYIYINGVAAANRGSRLPYTGRGNFTIGKQGEYAGGAEYFQGALDDIRIYNRALSAAEIQSLYSNGAK